MAKIPVYKYYDTSCDRCGNWATGDMSPSELVGSADKASKVLQRYGWVRRDGKTLCKFCATGEPR